MKKSFTLIEILVVATIVVLLTATATATYTAFLKQSRDAKRKTDLEQIRAALEMYRSNNDSYPLGTDSLTTPVTYIKSIPTDPKDNGVYPYTSSPVDCTGSSTAPSCNDYSITADLEIGGTYTVGPYGVYPTLAPTPTPTP